MGESKPIVVDGANVAFVEKSQQGQPKVSNLVAVRRALEEKGFDPIVIVDAALRHEIDDPDQLEAMIENKSVRQAPAGTDADYFILATADERQCPVVTNDEYQRYRSSYSWIRDRRVPLMIIDGQVYLQQDKLDQAADAG